MGKDKRIKAKKNISHLFVQLAAIATMITFIFLMIILVNATINNLNNNSINTLAGGLSQSKDMLAANSSIESMTSTAISSATLIVTVVGVFMTCVSIFAAFIIYIANSKLDDVDEKIIEFDKRIKVETHMRHVAFGLRHWDKGKYRYALEEFEQGLNSEDDACRLTANYYCGSVYNELYNENKNPIYLDRAESYLLSATQFESNLALLISTDAYASLGCLYGLRAEEDFGGDCCIEYLKKSEEFLKKAIKMIPSAVYYKNLAITYALNRNFKKAIECLEKGIQIDSVEKGFIDVVKRRENAQKFKDELFNKFEKTIIPDICAVIENHFDIDKNNDS